MYFRQTNTAVVLNAASAGAAGPDFSDNRATGLIVGINITSITGASPTLTVTLQGKDPISGTYYTVLASAALTATGYTELVVYPGATVAANVSASRPVPITWRINTAVGGTTPAVTATVSVQTVP